MPVLTQLLLAFTISLSTAPVSTLEHRLLYERMELQNVMDYQAFEQACKGYSRIERGKNILAVIDFTKPSTEERLYVLDLDKEELLYTSHVSHGQKSGEKYATSFSNVSGSHQSSLGFYLTDKTYIGGSGYSLLLNGLEEGFNDRARSRAVVIHGASYSDPRVIASTGRLGRSHGCPALPPALTRPIIDVIKEGAVLYIYAGNRHYEQQSRLLS